MILLCFMAFWLGGYIFSRNYDYQPKRYSSLDGVRGYLGYAVFLSHFLIWKEYVGTGVWDSRDKLTFNLGSASVYLFFCISAFLFIGKISEKNVDWRLLYINRVMRLVPLWIFYLLV
jgi:peptidoglycan/LPS O-acetylase OafA/YrhL